MAGDSSRKRTAWAMSLAVDERCSGVRRWAVANSASSIGPDSSVTPGDTAHTRSSGASAWASITVASASAALDKVYEK